MAISVRISSGGADPQVIEVQSGGSITVEPGDIIELVDIDRDDVEFSLDGDDLTLTLADGQTITFVGLGAALEADNPATLAFGDLSAGDIIASINDLIETVAPAAGPGAVVGISTGGTFRASGDLDLDDLGNPRVGANGPGDGTPPTPINPFGLEPTIGNPELGAGEEEANDIPRILDPEPATVDEDDLQIAEGSSFEGTDETDPVSFVRGLGILFGDDGPGSVSLAGNIAPAGLTSHGEPVTYVISPDGTLLTAQTAGGRVIFTIEVDAFADNDGNAGNGTGTYTITLFDQLDHEFGLGQNVGELSFGFTATDGNGDSVTGFFTVGFVDDVPFWDPDVTTKSAPILVDFSDFEASGGEGGPTLAGNGWEAFGNAGVAFNSVGISPTEGD